MSCVIWIFETRAISTFHVASNDLFMKNPQKQKKCTILKDGFDSKEKLKPLKQTPCKVALAAEQEN